MRIAIWALIVVGIFFLYQYTIGKVFAKYESCYSDTKDTLATQDEPDSSSCIAEKLAYDDLLSCIEKVQQENNFSSFLYQAAPAKKNIETDIKAHNRACLSQKVDLPKESFYMTSGSSR